MWPLRIADSWRIIERRFLWSDCRPRKLYGSSPGVEGRGLAVMSGEVPPAFYNLLHHVLPRDSNTTLPKVLANWGRDAISYRGGSIASLRPVTRFPWLRNRMARVFRAGVKHIGRNVSLTHTAAAPALPDGSPTWCQYLTITAAAEGSAFTGTSVLIPAHTENRHFFGRDFLKKIEGKVFENESLSLFFPGNQIFRHVMHFRRRFFWKQFF